MPRARDLTAVGDDLISSIFRTVLSLQSSVPDSILFGSLFMYFITHSLSYGVLAIFIIELMLSHELISWLLVETNGPLPRTADEKCRVGFKQIQQNVDRIFSHNPYPSYGIFSMTGLATYLGLATYDMADTVKALGAAWEGHNLVAYIFIGLILCAVIFSRLVICDDMGEVIMAVVLAFLCSAVFFYVNKYLFGKEAMNFLGLPYLVNKQEKGNAVYVCS